MYTRDIEYLGKKIFLVLTIYYIQFFFFPLEILLLGQEQILQPLYVVIRTVPENEQDVILTNNNISNNEIDNPHHFTYSYDNGSILKRIVEPFNHVHSIIEPSAFDVSNPSESNNAVIDSSSGVQSSAQSYSDHIRSTTICSTTIFSTTIYSTTISSTNISSTTIS
ncbi:hypothetical protein F8M41_022007 [Gigaspora margarita]|uniref:Uncharacterized protein n=1 Tax=Gigaspora margarita TaxID=4874 RepID=A0A8H4AFU3_GIGMA|nr:hypothetical protein F8M41_022007 [Gigaspora margarita]